LSLKVKTKWGKEAGDHPCTKMRNLLVPAGKM